MEYNTSNNELWFNQNGEEEEDVIQTPDADANQSPQTEQAVSGETPSMGDSEELDTGLSADTGEIFEVSSKANSYGSFRLPSIAEGGRDWATYPNGGLPAINNPDSSEFDPNAEGSRDTEGRVRWGSKDWDEYNSNKSSGENLSRGVMGGGFGSGSSTTVVTPPSNLGIPTGSGMKNMLPIIGGALVLGTIGYFSFIKK